MVHGPMRRLSLTLALLTAACARRAPRPVASTAHDAAVSPRLRYLVRPPTTPEVRVREGLTLHGAVRAENGRPAAAPHPRSAIAATARMADGTWRFATEDGGLWRADTFTGALTRLGELPARVDRGPDRGGGITQGAHHEGALVVRDATLRAHRLDADGTVRALPLARVIHALSVDPRTVLAITEPGTLLRSVDGGARFTPVRLPAGVALALWIDEQGVHVLTTAGSHTVREGTLVPDDRPRAPAPALTVPHEVSARVRAALGRPPWSLALGASVSPDGRAVFSVEGSRFVTRRARDGAVLRDEATPGADCALAVYNGGVGAVCTRSWARVVLARGVDEAGWHVLRDERDAAPVGEVRFDARSALWVTAAPCAQGDAPRGALCVTDAQGTRHTLRREGALVAAHAGEILLHDGEHLVAVDAAGLVRGEATLPAPRGLTATVTRASLAVIPRGDTGRRAVLRTAQGFRAVALPGDFAGVTDEGAWLAWSVDAGTLRRSDDGARWDPLPPPVEGASASLPLGGVALSCAGGWCALGDALHLTPEGAGEGPALSARASHPLVLQGVPQRTITCAHGAVSAAREIDHGAASTGYAVRAVATGDTVTVTWEGDRAQGRVQGTVPPRVGVRAEVRGVALADRPAALLTRCDTRGCDHLLATTGGVYDLHLGRAAPSGVEVHAFPEGFVVRVDDVRPEASLVTLARVDAGGAVLRRRSYALAGAIEDAAAGRWGDRDGLWIAAPPGRLRFHPLDGVDDVDVEVPAPDARTGPCAPGVTAEGEARWVHAVPVVRGDGWFLERGRWQHEQVLSLTRGGVCAREMGAGEPFEEDEGREGREEREPVRSFVLRAEGGRWVGDAWSGRRRITLRCNAME